MGFLRGFYRHWQTKTKLELKKQLTLSKPVSQIKMRKTNIIISGHLNKHWKNPTLTVKGLTGGISNCGLISPNIWFK